MGQGYLVDSNVIIDFCNGKLTESARLFLQNIEPQISIITNMELFAATNISAHEHSLLKEFVAIATVYPVSIDLVDTTVNIRQQYKIKLPDAIIAATAITYGLTLLSRNVADFKRIDNLQVIDPYSM